MIAFETLSLTARLFFSHTIQWVRAKQSNLILRENVHASTSALCLEMCDVHDMCAACTLVSMYPSSGVGVPSPLSWVQTFGRTSLPHASKAPHWRDARNGFLERNLSHKFYSAFPEPHIDWGETEIGTENWQPFLRIDSPACFLLLFRMCHL